MSEVASLGRIVSVGRIVRGIGGLWGLDHILVGQVSGMGCAASTSMSVLTGVACASSSCAALKIVDRRVGCTVPMLMSMLRGVAFASGRLNCIGEVINSRVGVAARASTTRRNCVAFASSWFNCMGVEIVNGRIGDATPTSPTWLSCITLASVSGMGRVGCVASASMAGLISVACGPIDGVDIINIGSVGPLHEIFCAYIVPIAVADLFIFCTRERESARGGNREWRHVDRRIQLVLFVGD